MIPVATFAGKNVAVFGLGGSGVATAAALVAGKAKVSAWDDNPRAVEAARGKNLPVEDLRAADWESFAALVLSPGVPLTHPAPAWPVASARTAGIEIVGDIELFCRERRRMAEAGQVGPFVAITGTNGKSTTTALVGHILQQAERDVAVGGNIGPAVLSLSPPKVGRTHVVECSSFQIDLAPTLDPTVGVLLNVAADHLDRHGTLAAYARIKERLVAGAGTAIVAVDDEWCVAIAERVARTRPVVRVSMKRTLADGVYAKGSEIFVAEGGKARRLVDIAGVATLRGTHNAQNVVAAVAACRAVGLDDPEIVAGIRTFPGLPHRLEEVGRRGAVAFVNDSKATNADAAAKALAVFDRIYWIAGGRPKKGGIKTLKRFFPKIVRAYLIGEAAEEFARQIGDDLPYQMCGTLQIAVQAAAADAADDRADAAVVLLSPACASYDQFQNFEKRGAQFRALVRQINGVTSEGEAA